MALAYHLVFGCYGFWLPNDPRGSGSDFVRCQNLLAFGDATRGVVRKVNSGMSLTSLQAKDALTYPAVVMTGLQARAAARGLAKAVAESDYCVLACSIMSDHVHAVVVVHRTKPKRIIGHLKARATQRLKEESLHPLARYEGPPSPWARGGWYLILDDDDDVHRSIE